MITITEVKTRRDRKRFVELPLHMYRDNPYFVPPLYADEMQMFRKNYVYNDQCESVFYLAFKDGVLVGRIQGILQRAANEKWGQKRARFTRFDCIDDQEVASALFGAVEAWAKSLGMEEVVGPLGYSDLEREGLLIEGFDQLSTFEEQYNFPYYQKLIETCGYEKDVDWFESRLRAPKDLDPRYERLSEMIMKKYHLHFPNVRSTREFIKKYGDELFAVLDETYAKLYGTVPFTEGMKKMTLANFNLVIDLRFVTVILDENEKVVCFGLCLPAIGEAVQKSGGRLTIPTLIRVLKAIKRPKVIDLALVGVLDEYRMKGVSTILFTELLKYLSHDIEYAETNLNLEDNHSIRNQWTRMFDAQEHKKRRSFKKSI
ncbi:MAG: N-acetyltransferase [Christensenellaceae bacterium]